MKIIGNIKVREEQKPHTENIHKLQLYGLANKMQNMITTHRMYMEIHLKHYSDILEAMCYPYVLRFLLETEIGSCYPLIFFFLI